MSSSLPTVFSHYFVAHRAVLTG